MHCNDQWPLVIAQQRLVDKIDLRYFPLLKIFKYNMEILSSHLFPCLLMGKTMWLETAVECRSKIVACPEKIWENFEEASEAEVEDGEVDLVPLDAVDALAVQVEAAVENSRAPGLPERKWKVSYLWFLSLY